MSVRETAGIAAQTLMGVREEIKESLATLDEAVNPLKASMGRSTAERKLAEIRRSGEALRIQTVEPVGEGGPGSGPHPRAGFRDPTSAMYQNQHNFDHATTLFSPTDHSNATQYHIKMSNVARNHGYHHLAAAHTKAAFRHSDAIDKLKESGVKGMKWGVHKDEDGYVRVTHPKYGTVAVAVLDKDNRAHDITFLNSAHQKINTIRQPAMRALGDFERSLQDKKESYLRLDRVSPQRKTSCPVVRESGVKGMKWGVRKGGDNHPEGATANELYNYAHHGPNTEQLWRQQGIPIQQNLGRKFDKGTYDHAKAPILWKHFADTIDESYNKEFNGQTGHMATPSERRELAQRMADEFHAHLKGEKETRESDLKEVQFTRPGNILREAMGRSAFDRVAEKMVGSPKKVHSFSQSEISNALNNALRAKFAPKKSKKSGDLGIGFGEKVPYVRDVFPQEHAVVYDFQGKTYQCSYQIDPRSGDAKLGDSVEVKQAYVDK